MLTETIVLYGGRQAVQNNGDGQAGFAFALDTELAFLCLPAIGHDVQKTCVLLM